MTTFATLARRPAPPMSGTRFLVSPAGLLLQMSAITFSGMALIPLIGARYASTRRGSSLASVAEDTATTAVATSIPITIPTAKQLRALASTLRSRLSPSATAPGAHPFDGIFLLRQLNMVTQTPSLPLTPSSPIPPLAPPIAPLNPSKWLHSLPALAALHSILRTLSHPTCSLRTRDALLPLAGTLASHSLHWDEVVWSAVLRSRAGEAGEEGGVRWQRLLARTRGQLGGEGLDEETAVMCRLDERPRVGEGEADAQVEMMRRWEERIEARRRDRWAFDDDAELTQGTNTLKRRREATELLSDRLLRHRVESDQLALDAIPPSAHSPSSSSSTSSTLRPLSSLPGATLDLLFLALLSPAPLPPASSPSTTSALNPKTLESLALAHSLSRISLGHMLAPKVYALSTGIALQNGRVDLAARVWSAHLLALQGPSYTSTSGAEYRRLMRDYAAIRRDLRDTGRRFTGLMVDEDSGAGAQQARRKLASVASLARAADREWVRLFSFSSPASSVTTITSSSPAANPISSQTPLNELLAVLSTFPAPPLASTFPRGSQRRTIARIHAKVASMVRRVFRGVLEDTLGRQVSLGSGKVVLGELAPGRRDVEANNRRRLPLDIKGFNILITYSLRQLHSSELALRLIEVMRQQGLEPSAATHNILLDVLARSGKDALELAAGNGQQGNERTWPTLVRYLVDKGEWDLIERMVFFLLPELDLHNPSPPPTAIAATAEGSRPISRADYASITRAPPPGRSPWLYVALLSALVAAGRTGLAERVFRSARWAAELSRQEQPSPSSTSRSTPDIEQFGHHYHHSAAWTLPPQAFVLMLQLYASEARRGRALLSSSQSPSSPPASSSRASVRGWGRHAIRVFLLSERRADLRSRLGESVNASRRIPSGPARRMDLVGTVEPFLRAEAAAIVATWELEGGSKGPELESLRRAMGSPQAREALEELFPERRSGGEEKLALKKREERWMRSRGTARDEQARVRGLGMRGHQKT